MVNHLKTFYRFPSPSAFFPWHSIGTRLWHTMYDDIFGTLGSICWSLFGHWERTLLSGQKPWKARIWIIRITQFTSRASRLPSICPCRKRVAENGSDPKSSKIGAQLYQNQVDDLMLSAHPTLQLCCYASEMHLVNLHVIVWRLVVQIQCPRI